MSPRSDAPGLQDGLQGAQALHVADRARGCAAAVAPWPSWSRAASVARRWTSSGVVRDGAVGRRPSARCRRGRAARRGRGAADSRRGRRACAAAAAQAAGGADRLDAPAAEPYVHGPAVGEPGPARAAGRSGRGGSGGAARAVGAGGRLRAGCSGGCALGASRTGEPRRSPARARRSAMVGRRRSVEPGADVAAATEARSGDRRARWSRITAVTGAVRSRRPVRPDHGAAAGPRNGFGRSAADRVMSSSLAPIAQSVERLHGKEKVYGSIPYWGSGVMRFPAVEAGTDRIKAV